MCVGNRQNDRLPVMVWFHSGDFNTGTPAIWDASVFVTKQKVRFRAVARKNTCETTGKLNERLKLMQPDIIDTDIITYGRTEDN